MFRIILFKENIALYIFDILNFGCRIEFKTKKKRTQNHYFIEEY